jgi:hypothetical protein
MVVAVADLRSKDWRGLELVLHVSKRSTASPSDWIERSEAPRGTYCVQYELSSTVPVGALCSLRVTSFLTHLARFWEASFQLDRYLVFQGRNSFNLIGILSVSNPVSRLTLRRSLADEMRSRVTQNWLFRRSSGALQGFGTRGTLPVTPRAPNSNQQQV